MSVLYIALPTALVIAAAAVIGFAWTLRTGQLDDLDTPPIRMLFDDEPDQTTRSSNPTTEHH